MAHPLYLLGRLMVRTGLLLQKTLVTKGWNLITRFGVPEEILRTVREHLGESAVLSLKKSTAPFTGMRN